MDLFVFLNLNELSLAMSKLSMYPLFDMAHYTVSVMALKEQPGAVEVAQRSPFACWFSSMLYCFGGAVLSSLMLAEPPVAPLSNDRNVLMASLIWYLVFYSPQDMVYRCATILPIRVVLSGMKEVTRTWKVLGGVAQARKHYQEGLLVMIAVGWAKGAGGGLISNFEQLVRGIWRPETNELLKMSYPTKVTLMGAVLFSLQQSQYLPLQKHHLMFVYTVFLVVNKARMMLSGSSSWPFSPVEGAVYRALFAAQSTDWTSAAKAKAPVRTPASDTCAAAKTDVNAASDSQNGSAVSDTDGNVLRAPGASGEGSPKSGLRNKDQTGDQEAGSNKKTD
ncbi:hypothetical protein MATL_G00090270 [Megalops atlanticus]|uniref:Trimeric intracellular cation channel type B n=1 Tax=Megalops atlanticus TaxID=7932 RepID=A0A9D3Q8U9_MEGAT|nr:hypothetical protein MATL_G00090270 [Megalops atlanticus]